MQNLNVNYFGMLSTLFIFETKIPTSKAIILLLFTLLIMQTARVNNPALLSISLLMASPYLWQQHSRHWRQASSSRQALRCAAGVTRCVRVPPFGGPLVEPCGGPPAAWESWIQRSSSRRRDTPSRGSPMNSWTKL